MERNLFLYLSLSLQQNGEPRADTPAEDTEEEEWKQEIDDPQKPIWITDDKSNVKYAVTRVPFEQQVIIRFLEDLFQCCHLLLLILIH